MLLFAMTGVLALRAGHVQIVQREAWRERAAAQMTRSQPIEAERGRILDVKSREVAIDRPCIDACVDFRALTNPPDEKWVRAVAAERLQAALRDAYKQVTGARRTKMLDAESKRVRADINTMWSRLARVSGTPLAEVEAARDAVVDKVVMRRRYVWYRNYHRAVRKFEQREPAPKWRRWLVDEKADAPTPEQFTTLTVEEEADHPILKSVDVNEQNELRKHVERYPGLTLRAGTERHYPFMDAGCHLLGNLSRVIRKDLVSERNLGADELWQYLPNDQIGRTGIESLAEPLLRGTRGRIETMEGRENPAGRVEPVAGKDVQVTIDIELQGDVTQLFRNATVANDLTGTYDVVEMHGGAVVIDVPTGEVRVLASYPTFDLNEFDEKFAELNADELDLPLLNRATQVAREPGSTVKPIVGLAGIAQGVIGLHEGIECSGFMEVNGRRIPHGKCWTQDMFGVGHHQIPRIDPHIGRFGNPDGSLTFDDAVQRSCNVYFETVGDRLKMDGLSKWYDRFGLGRPTGLGIAEAPGSLPNRWKGDPSERRFATWISAIGQSPTLATPVQMANVAATLARDGVWMRPRLIRDGHGLPMPGDNLGPARVDLGLPRAAVAAARQGMHDVVNTPAGSAYKVFRRSDLLIAAKTGTAEAAPLRVPVRDKNGNKVVDEEGRTVKRTLAPSSAANPNPEAAWYRGFGPEGTDLKHSWFVGFAPADDPKIAFAVMLEYGGNGSTGAGLIARDMLELCVERGYLRRNPAAAADPAPGDAAPTGVPAPAELLTPIVGD